LIRSYYTYAAICLLLTVCQPAFSQVKVDTLSRYVYEDVPQMPEFPGGIIEMEKYVLKNLVLPVLKEAPPRAGVYTRFVVNADGSVSDVKTARSSGNLAVDDSVKAVIRRMPLWKPGMLNGKPVNCYYNLPISCFKFK
jgi:protein TonB